MFAEAVRPRCIIVLRITLNIDSQDGNFNVRATREEEIGVQITCKWIGDSHIMLTVVVMSRTKVAAEMVEFLAHGGCAQ